MSSSPITIDGVDGGLVSVLEFSDGTSAVAVLSRDGQRMASTVLDEAGLQKLSAAALRAPIYGGRYAEAMAALEAEGSL